MRVDLCTGVELILMRDVVVPRPFESLLLDPGPGLTGRGELLDGDEVVLVADIDEDMDSEVR